jgi:RNA polymerase sigma-70 factor (ECF subfamily)
MLRGWRKRGADLAAGQHRATRLWEAASLAMTRYLAGDSAAFIDLYLALAPRLRSHLLRFMGDEGRTDDLVQQTFLQIHLSRERFTRGAALGPWVITIAHRLLINELRRAKTETSVLGALSYARDRVPYGASLEDLIDAKHLAARIGDGLDGLPASHRRAFQLVRHHGLSMAEASRELGVSIAAVKVRVHRASLALRKSVRAGEGLRL